LCYFVWHFVTLSILNFLFNTKDTKVFIKALKGVIEI